MSLDAPNIVPEAFREEIVDAVVLAASDLYRDRPRGAAALRHLIVLERQGKKHITGPNVRHVPLKQDIANFLSEIPQRIDTQEQKNRAAHPAEEGSIQTRCLLVEHTA